MSEGDCRYFRRLRRTRVLLAALFSTAATSLSTSKSGRGQERGRESCGYRKPFYNTSLHSIFLPFELIIMGRHERHSPIGHAPFRSNARTKDAYGAVFLHPLKSPLNDTRYLVLGPEAAPPAYINSTY